MAVERFLRGVALLHAVGEQDLALLASSAHTMRFERGALLPQPAHPAEAVTFVERGSVRIALPGEEGRHLTVSVRHPGEYFWQVAADEAGAPRSRVEALVDGTLAHRFPRARFDALLVRYPSVALALIADLSGHLGEAYGRLRAASLCSAEGAIARTLLQLPAAGDPPTIEVTHDELAAWVGVSREHATRVLRRLRRAGLIDQARQGRIRIVRPLDLSALTT